MTTTVGNFTSTPPRIAALETSGRSGSVALALGPTLLAQQVLPPTSRHAIELMPALLLLCQQQNWITPQTHQPTIDHIYISIGPGSFTGLRIAVAVARALAQALRCQIVAVPSLDVLAQNAPPDFPVVVPILDAKRGHVFAARYQRNTANQLILTAGPALVEPAPFLAQAAALGKTAVLGEGVPHHLQAILATPNASPLPEPLWHAQASTVHRLGYQKALRHEFANVQTLLPLYIRLPEAEEVYRQKHPLNPPPTD